MNHKTLQRLKTTVWTMIAAVSATTFISCDDNIEMGNRFTFKGELISTYLENNPDRFSHFTEILKKAKIGRTENTKGSILKTLSTYGEYTCFAPTNEAIDTFLKQQHELHLKGERTGITSPYIEELSDSMALEIAKNHIIEQSFKTIDVSKGAFPKTTMNGRETTIKFEVDESTGRVYPELNNGTSRIIEQDLKKENGYVQVIDNVLNPSRKYISELINEQEEFSIFYEAVKMTGLDSLLSVYTIAPDYDPYVEHGHFLETEESTSPLPLTKVQCYTLLIEPNTLFHNKGINNIQDLIAFAEKWYGKEAPGEYRNQENALYKFVAYHIIDRKLLYSSSTGSGGFVMQDYKYADFDSKVNLNIKNFDTQEYYETMLPYTMIKVTKPYTNPQLKSEIVLNYAQENGTLCYNEEMREHLNVVVEFEETTVEKYPDVLKDFDGNSLNGMIYTIDKILIYNEKEMQGNVLNERIRMDLSALFPELTNNKVRWDLSSSGNLLTYIPNGYCKDFIITGESTEVFYLRPRATFGYTCANFQGDEFIVEGTYDFRYRIPHVPEGTYEIRFGYPKGYYRGVCQFYVDGKVAGIPVDLRWNAETDRLIGWISDDGITEDEIRENDKAMRNRGYMKGPASIILEAGGEGGTPVTMRSATQPLRKIIGTYYLAKGDHWLRFKDVSEEAGINQFSQDYLEIVPLTITNNTLKPEDRN